MINFTFYYYINVESVCKFFFLFSFIILILNIDIKISVIIPTYNREKLIGKSIKSVLNQTYKNLEVIVVDDGSTDKTKEEIDKIEDKRIKYIKIKNNVGASIARNIGIFISNGKYISFQDSDDIYHPNKIELQLKNVINKKSDLDFCKIRVFYSKTNILFFPNRTQEKSVLSGKILDELISTGNFISTQSILIKRNIMKEYYFDPDMPKFQDYEVILRMIPKLKISYTPKILVDLYRQKDSISFSKIKLKQAINILLKKQYDFNEKQKKAFINYLNHFFRDKIK